MSAHIDRRLKFGSVSYGSGWGSYTVEVWMQPSWLKGDPLVKCELSPQQARQTAIRLLQCADAAEGL